MSQLSPEVQPVLRRLLGTVQLDKVLTGLALRDQQIFTLRLARQFGNLYEGLEPLYGVRPDFETVLARLVTKLAEFYRDRPEALKVLDLERELTPDWFQRPEMVGYVAYAERFRRIWQASPSI